MVPFKYLIVVLILTERALKIIKNVVGASTLNLTMFILFSPFSTILPDSTDDSRICRWNMFARV